MKRVCVLLLLAVTAALEAQSTDRETVRLTEEIRRSPSDAKAYYNRGGIHCRTGDYARARADWERALRFGHAARGVCVARDGLWTRGSKSPKTPGPKGRAVAAAGASRTRPVRSAIRPEPFCTSMESSHTSMEPFHTGMKIMAKE
ncbi:MAG: tetratricopeptide repeat protein [Treponema sp.]|jgi:hypothetical protein|nr:tetratricopeptide repeat protein [Treponema sp.]